KTKQTTMSKLKIFSIAFLATAGLAQAQDIEAAKKAIDAEQYEKAKTILKSIVQSKPSDGRATFLLGNVYLTQNVADSAKIYFDKGVTASDNGKLNYIGLGQLDLDNGNVSAAQSNFALATKGIRKKDTEELIGVARAYLNSDKPDVKAALTTLTKAKAANPNDAQVQLA